MRFSSGGNTYTIQELTRADCAIVPSWFESERVHEWLDFGAGRQKLDALSIRMMSASPDHFVRVVVDADGRRLGVFGLQQVRNPFRVAQFWGVRPMLRPPAPLRNVDAMRAMLRQAFQMFDLSSVQAWAVDGNLRSIRILEQLGFKECGRWRRCHPINNVLRDRLMYDLLPEEFDWPLPAADVKAGKPVFAHARRLSEIAAGQSAALHE